MLDFDGATSSISLHTDNQSQLSTPPDLINSTLKSEVQQNVLNRNMMQRVLSNVTSVAVLSIKTITNK